MAEIQELERTIPFSTNGNNTAGADFVVLRWLGAAGQTAPGYWSRARDIYLRSFVLKSDYLKIAVQTFVEKVASVPFIIQPRDRSVKAHVALAGQIEQDLLDNSGIYKGFEVEFSKFVADYLTTDNGGFLLVMGGGAADGPIVGPPVGVLHLDSLRCTRSGIPEYPVTYHHSDGKRYALHYTRVLYMSSMPSADAELYDVGLCATSRALDWSQELLDMAVYMQEKLGGRPPRQMVVVETGATSDQVASALRHTESMMDAIGTTHFSRTPILAPRQGSTLPLKLQLLDLASVPDGFDRQQQTMLAVAVIASAFGLDMRDLAHAFGVSGTTRADAEVQQHKTRTKGVGKFLADFIKQANRKLLPDTLEAVFDYVDDEEDKQEAEIRKVRAEGRNVNLSNDSITLRIAREQMLEEEEITEEQFENMELADGRLADGLDVLMLFQSKDSEINQLLALGVADPLDIEVNDPATMLTAIRQQVLAAWIRHDTAPNASIKRKVRQALAALERLRTAYTMGTMHPEEQLMMMPEDEEESTDEEPEKAEEILDETKSLHTKQDELLDELAEDYRVDFERLVEAAANEEITRPTFEERLAELVAAMLIAAFLRGSRYQAPSELSLELTRLVQVEVELNLAAIPDFANDIYAGRYSPDKLGLSSALSRIGLWTGALAGIYALGQVYRRDNPFYQWQYGPTEHCADCKRLNGQVHTAAEWRKSGWTPRARGLACHGYRCQCRFVEASGPSRGNF